MLLLICNRELLFIGKRKDEDDMAKSTKTYEERIRALEKKEQESIEATKKLIAQRKELEKRKKAEEMVLPLLCRRCKRQSGSERIRWNRK